MKRKFKVLLTRRLHDFALDKLRKKYEITVHSGKIPMPKNRLLNLIKDKDGLICFPYDSIDKQIINSAKKLKIISTYSVGFDHIDIKYAKKKKIKIGYTPDVLTNATAELTISLMLDLLRRITEGDRLIRKNNWTEIFGAYDYVGRDVSGKTIGILGMGRIGKSVAMKALGLGMNVIYHNRKPMPKKMEIFLKSKYVSLNNLFKKSDVLTIHIPYSRETHQLVDSSLLSKMKKTSFLINTSRGKIVNENDLIMYLQQNKIQGAGLDVFEKEPINKKNKLTKLENTVLAPHIGSSTDETRYEMTEIAIKNLILGLNDKKLVYSV
jgi:glyoxylate reductase|tara:strand:- start:5476 stop:6444 length:969 start_codon:yes stop_codon:yes gene_type:complete